MNKLKVVIYNFVEPTKHQLPFRIMVGLIGLLWWFLFPPSSSAQTISCTEFLCDPHNTLCGLLCQVIPQIPNFVIGTGVVIAIVFIVIHAISYTTAGDDQKKITQAKGGLLWAFVGLALLILAYGIIRLVATVLGIDPDEIFVIRGVANCEC